VADTAVVEELLDAIGSRDRERIASCFAPDAKLRALTPHRLREEDGPDAIAGQYGYWLDPLESFAVTSGDVTAIADRARLRYRFRGRDPVKGWQENEHTAYATVVEGRVAALDLTCAGFRPAEPPD
jgi:SnoaL-like domain